MQVCFIQDYLRANWDGGNAERCGRWLHALVGPALRRQGHHTFRLSHTLNGIQALLAKTLNLSWPALFSDPDAAFHHAAILPFLDGADFVIGFELSPNQMRVLHAAGVFFLDVAIDPIRFERDIFLSLRTNSPDLAGVLAQQEIRSEAILHRRPPVPLPAPNRPDNVLFVGQTDIDASLVTNGRLGTIDPYITRLREQFDTGQCMWLKPHPYGRVHRSVQTLHEVFTRSRIVTDNVYTMLASGKVAHVVTLSSGVALEAPFFGVAATTLLTPDVRDVPDVSRTFRLSPEALPLSLWESAGRSSSCGGVKRGSLRTRLGLAWAYPFPQDLPSHRVEHGEVIDFSSRNNGRDAVGLRGSGWSFPESTGCWTDGPLATVLVQLPGQSLDCSLQCRAFVPPGAGPLRLTIEVRGNAHYRKRVILDSQRLRSVRFSLPCTDGLTEIALHIDNPRSPELAGLSGDRRALGLHVISAKFRRRSAKARRWLSSIAPAMAAVPPQRYDQSRV